MEAARVHYVRQRRQLWVGFCLMQPRALPALNSPTQLAKQQPDAAAAVGGSIYEQFNAALHRSLRDGEQSEALHPHSRRRRHHHHLAAEE